MGENIFCWSQVFFQRNAISIKGRFALQTLSAKLCLHSEPYFKEMPIILTYTNEKHHENNSLIQYAENIDANHSVHSWEFVAISSFVFAN